MTRDGIILGLLECRHPGAAAASIRENGAVIVPPSLYQELAADADTILRAAPRRIVRSPGIGKGRAKCTATVHVTEAETITRHQREFMADRTGRPINECGRVSMYLVDGAPRCLNHAGQDAIKILMGQP